MYASLSHIRLQPLEIFYEDSEPFSVLKRVVLTADEHRVGECMHNHVCPRVTASRTAAHRACKSATFSAFCTATTMR